MSQAISDPHEHPAVLALARLDTELAHLAGQPLWTLGEPDLLGLRIGLESTRARLSSVVLTTTREIDTRGAATATGAASTAAWLRGRLRIHPGAARAETVLAAMQGHGRAFYQQLTLLTIGPMDSAHFGRGIDDRAFDHFDLPR